MQFQRAKSVVALRVCSVLQRRSARSILGKILGAFKYHGTRSDTMDTLIPLNGHSRVRHFRLDLGSPPYRGEWPTRTEAARATAG